MTKQNLASKRRFLRGHSLIFWIPILAIFMVLLFPHAQFVLGGALINVGFRLQDHHSQFDLRSEGEMRPEGIWDRLLLQNQWAQQVRRTFPRTTRHPVVAVLACMDARIDTSELAGDTRRFYYVVRTAGSILGPAEQDMLELAVQNGVKVILLTRHSDCAAEKIARESQSHGKFPHLVESVHLRKYHVQEFLNRPYIAERISRGDLIVREMLIDTATGALLPDMG